MSPNPDATDIPQHRAFEFGEMVEEYNQEYDTLNTTLDEIESCLSTLESQNDDLYARLQDLLESSRQTRQEFQELNSTLAQNEEQGTGDIARMAELSQPVCDSNFKEDSKEETVTKNEIKQDVVSTAETKNKDLVEDKS